MPPRDESKETRGNRREVCDTSAFPSSYSSTRNTCRLLTPTQPRLKLKQLYHPRPADMHRLHVLPSSLEPEPGSVSTCSFHLRPWAPPFPPASCQQNAGAGPAHLLYFTASSCWDVAPPFKTPPPEGYDYGWVTMGNCIPRGLIAFNLLFVCKKKPFRLALVVQQCCSLFSFLLFCSIVWVWVKLKTLTCGFDQICFFFLFSGK